MGANVTEVCDETLSGYLNEHDLFKEDFPTDTGQFNAILGCYQVCYSLQKLDERIEAVEEGEGVEGPEPEQEEKATNRIF